MSWFPQIGQGSIVQFPLQRRRTWRTISNELEGGEWLGLPDPTGGRIEWSLSYRDLNDDEAGKINGVFVSSRGSAGAFGFADPLANLIAWSEDFSKPDWQAGLLGLTTGVSDPLGTYRAGTVVNGTPSEQSFSQTVSVPGQYICCFSVWLRSDAPGTVSLQRDGVECQAETRPGWKRFYVSGAGGTNANHSTVSITIPPGFSADVWAPQFEVQAYPSQYKVSMTASGVYPQTYFAGDELKMTSSGPGLTDCKVSLISRI